jgi:hypothetical protein
MASASNHSERERFPERDLLRHRLDACGKAAASVGVAHRPREPRGRCGIVSGTHLLTGVEVLFSAAVLNGGRVASPCVCVRVSVRV